MSYSVPKEQLEQWVKLAQEKGATHLIVACDMFSYEDYPVLVMQEDDIEEKYHHYRINMQSVHEVYSFTGKYTVEEQLAEQFAIHLD